jgi:hypothetical protein
LRRIFYRQAVFDAGTFAGGLQPPCALVRHTAAKRACVRVLQPEVRGWSNSPLAGSDYNRFYLDFQ